MSQHYSNIVPNVCGYFWYNHTIASFINRLWGCVTLVLSISIPGSSKPPQLLKKHIKNSLKHVQSFLCKCYNINYLLML